MENGFLNKTIYKDEISRRVQILNEVSISANLTHDSLKMNQK